MLKKLVKQGGRNVRDLMLVAGVGPTLRVDDRRVLEGVIFAGLKSDPTLKRALLVGCHWYTWHYERLLAPIKVSTLEIDPARRRYGARHRHVVDSVEFVGRHFAPGSQDIATLCGVIGWGLDDFDVADRSVAALHDVLRPGGVFVLSVNDTPENRPFDVDRLPALRRFEPWVFPPLGTQRHRCAGEMRGTFTFYRRPNG